MFGTRVNEQFDSHVIKIPKHEITNSGTRSGEVYRTAVLSAITGTAERVPPSETTEAQRERDASEPPVDEGEPREVDIEDIGEQGDGITRVERGFVVIVPDTEMGERVTVEITDVQPNVAFGEVTERQTHF